MDGIVNPLMDGCACPGCSALQREVDGDARLITLYGARLLQRGWAGRLSDAERAYVTAHAGWFARSVASGQQQAARLRAGGANPQGETASPSPQDPAATPLAVAA